MGPIRRRIALAFTCLGLAACAGPQVRTLGTGGGAPAYSLQGTSRGEVRAEAARLCPKGYEVLREAQNFHPQGDDDPSMRWLQELGDFVVGVPGNQAQATVRCHA